VTHLNISYNKWRFLNVQALRGWCSGFSLVIRILFGSRGFESYISARLADIFQLLLVKKCSARPCRTADGVNEEDGNDSDLRVNNFTCVVCVIIIIIIYHIHSYLPDTNHVSRADNAAAVLRLQCMVLSMINLS